MSERKIEELEYTKYNSDIKILRFKENDEVFKMNPDGSFTIHESRIKLSEGAEPKYSSFIRKSEFIDRSDRTMGPKVIVGSNADYRVVIMADHINDKQMFNIAKDEGVYTAETLLGIQSISVDKDRVEMEQALKAEEKAAKAKESESEEKPKPTRTRRCKPAAKTKKETETETDSDV